MSVLVFLQARMSSSRLPGKVLLDLKGKPMLIRQIERIHKAHSIDGLVVLTSKSPSDDAIYEVCKAYSIECFRGDLDNVLNRFYTASLYYKPEHIVRVTGDCPLLDWTVLDQVVNKHLSDPHDYTSNTLEPTYPDGLDVEIFTKDCLDKMHDKAESATQKEHVTYYCYTHSDDFTLQNVTNPEGDKSTYRWTVDNVEDFALVESVYEGLYSINNDFIAKDIEEYLLKNPDVARLNQHINRNEGLLGEVIEGRPYE